MSGFYSPNGYRIQHSISNIVTNIDIAPTLIEMAGGTVPEHMDGESFLRLIKTARDQNKWVISKQFVSEQANGIKTICLKTSKLYQNNLDNSKLPQI